LGFPAEIRLAIFIYHITFIFGASSLAAEGWGGILKRMTFCLHHHS